MRFEYVASVVLPIFAVSLSYAVDEVVSAVSMCSQKVSVALLHPDGIVTLCERCRCAYCRHRSARRSWCRRGRSDRNGW